MTNYSVENVDEFIAASPAESRSHLKEIRAAVRAGAPQAAEKIGYGKPYYKLNTWVAGFDVYKSHIGIEIWDGLSASERAELEKNGYKTGSKTFQVRFDQPVPSAVIKKLVKAQAARDVAKAARKTTRKTK